MYKIPKNHEQEILYTLDNAYYFNHVGLNTRNKMRRNKNLKSVREVFINEKLPPKRFDKSIVVHVRLGDSIDRKENASSRKRLKVLLRKLEKDFPDHDIHIHSDGKPSFLSGKYIFHTKETPVLTVISDMVHADILVCGVSALSYFCSFINKGELILVPNKINHSLPDNSFTFDDYLQKSSPVKLGTNYGGWYVPRKMILGKDSIVYCGGCGEDISFDLTISHMYKSNLVLIDPTSRAFSHYKDVLEYYHKLKDIKDFGGDIQKDYEGKIRDLNPDFDKIKFLEVGLWEKKDQLKFFKPVNQKYVSNTLVEGMFSKDYDLVNVKSIKDIMDEHGHTRIDLLKLDIEGAEIETVNQMLDDEIYPNYVLIEFDLKLKKMDKEKETEKLISRLSNYYNLFKDDNMNITFVKKAVD